MPVMMNMKDPWDRFQSAIDNFRGYAAMREAERRSAIDEGYLKLAESREKRMKQQEDEARFKAKYEGMLSALPYLTQQNYGEWLNTARQMDAQYGGYGLAPFLPDHEEILKMKPEDFQEWRSGLANSGQWLMKKKGLELENDLATKRMNSQFMKESGLIGKRGAEERKTIEYRTNEAIREEEEKKKRGLGTYGVAGTEKIPPMQKDQLDRIQSVASEYRRLYANVELPEFETRATEMAQNALEELKRLLIEYKRRWGELPPGFEDPEKAQNQEMNPSGWNQFTNEALGIGK